MRDFRVGSPMMHFPYILSVYFCIAISSSGCGCPCECGEEGRGSLPSLNNRERNKPSAAAYNSVVREKFHRLVSTMEKGYNPPMWIGKVDLGHYLSRTVVYFDTTYMSAKKLVDMKEPCRIEGYRRYNKKRFHDFFSYSESPLSPKIEDVIATYTLTPLKLLPNSGSSKQDDEFVDIKILSIAWPHLEDSTLPDFSSLYDVPSVAERENLLRIHLHKIFSKIIRCMKREKLGIAIFGDLDIDRSIRVARKTFGIDFVAIMDEVFRHYFVGSHFSESRSIGSTHLPTPRVMTGSLVDAINTIREAGNLEKVLFINSASPVALLGNGNEMQNSTDGYFGRMTAISVLGWGVTNPDIRYEFVIPDSSGYNELNID